MRTDPPPCVRRRIHRPFLSTVTSLAIKLPPATFNSLQPEPRFRGRENESWQHLQQITHFLYSIYFLSPLPITLIVWREKIPIFEQKRNVLAITNFFSIDDRILNLLKYI